MRNGTKQREQRHAVRLGAQVRAGVGWSAVTVHDVSPHGLLLSADTAPKLGSYLELRRDTTRITARIVWSDGVRFGVRTQDALDVRALIAPPRPRRIPNTPPSFGGRQPAPRVGADDATDRARFIGRAVEFTLLLVALVLAAAAIGAVLTHTLAPLHAIGAYLVAS